MIRPSDKGPGKARPPRTKQGGRGGSTPPPGGGEGNKGWSLCPLAIVVPALLLAACTAMGWHGP